MLDALDEHITNDEDRKIALNRRQIVQEIYSSEESYISRLAIVIEVSLTLGIYFYQSLAILLCRLTSFSKFTVFQETNSRETSSSYYGA